MGDYQTLAQYDLSVGDVGEDQDGDGTPDWYDEGYQLKGFIPGSNRFVLYATLADNLNIWDLVTSRTVRGVSGGKNYVCILALL